MLCCVRLALTPEQPVSKMGFFGPRSEFLYALSTVETLSLWSLTTAEPISDFKGCYRLSLRCVASHLTLAFKWWRTQIFARL
jgi:hypothetical protein